MNASSLILCMVFFVMSSAHAQEPEALSGPWTLEIESLEHKNISTLIVHFTTNKARSCLGGNWKAVVVESYKTSDKKFFPVDEPLSYQFDKHKLSIGRNGVCDAYLQLSGELSGTKIIGEYFEFGWSRKNLGYFSLVRGAKQ